MKRQRRTFSAEFKREAAQLIVDQGCSASEASRPLGVGEAVLRRWVQQLQRGATPKGKVPTSDQQRIQELEGRVNRLEREKAT